MTRILSQNGNVIAADFRPSKFDPSSLEIKIQVISEILYSDDKIMLTRATVTLDGKPSNMPPMHFMADLTTGKIVHT